MSAVASSSSSSPSPPLSVLVSNLRSSLANLNSNSSINNFDNNENKNNDNNKLSIISSESPWWEEQWRELASLPHHVNNPQPNKEIHKKDKTVNFSSSSEFDDEIFSSPNENRIKSKIKKSKNKLKKSPKISFSEMFEETSSDENENANEKDIINEEEDENDEIYNMLNSFKKQNKKHHKNKNMYTNKTKNKNNIPPPSNLPSDFNDKKEKEENEDSEDENLLKLLNSMKNYPNPFTISNENNNRNIHPPADSNINNTQNSSIIGDPFSVSLSTHLNENANEDNLFKSVLSFSSENSSQEINKLLDLTTMKKEYQQIENLINELEKKHEKKESTHEEQNLKFSSLSNNEEESNKDSSHLLQKLMAEFISSLNNDSNTSVNPGHNNSVHNNDFPLPQSSKPAVNPSHPSPNIFSSNPINVSNSNFSPSASTMNLNEFLSILQDTFLKTLKTNNNTKNENDSNYNNHSNSTSTSSTIDESNNKPSNNGKNPSGSLFHYDINGVQFDIHPLKNSDNNKHSHSQDDKIRNVIPTSSNNNPHYSSPSPSFSVPHVESSGRHIHIQIEQKLPVAVPLSLYYEKITKKVNESENNNVNEREIKINNGINSSYHLTSTIKQDINDILDEKKHSVTKILPENSPDSYEKTPVKLSESDKTFDENSAPHENSPGLNEKFSDEKSDAIHDEMNNVDSKHGKIPLYRPPSLSSYVSSRSSSPFKHLEYSDIDNDNDRDDEQDDGQGYIQSNESSRKNSISLSNSNNKSNNSQKEEDDEEQDFDGEHSPKEKEIDHKQNNNAINGSATGEYVDKNETNDNNNNKNNNDEKSDINNMSVPRIPNKNVNLSFSQPIIISVVEENLQKNTKENKNNDTTENSFFPSFKPFYNHPYSSYSPHNIPYYPIYPPLPSSLPSSRYPLYSSPSVLNEFYPITSPSSSPSFPSPYPPLSSPTPFQSFLPPKVAPARALTPPTHPIPIPIVSESISTSPSLSSEFLSFLSSLNVTSDEYLNNPSIQDLVHKIAYANAASIEEE